MNSRRRSVLSLLVFVLAIVASSCSHDDVAPSAELTVLQDARVWDGTGSPAQEHVAFLIRKDRIEALLRPGDKIPQGARIIDASGLTIIPALIAAHAHLGLTKGSSSGAENITEANVLRQLKKYMSYGIGTVLSLGTDHDFIYDLREKRLRGEIQTPLILTAGHGFGMPGGAPPETMGMDQIYRPTSAADVHREMDELVSHHPDIVKVWVDDFNHAMPAKMNPALYRDVIKEAHRHGLKVAAHVYYLEDAKRLARDGVDVFAHSVRDQAVDHELIELMRKNHIALIPTLTLDESFFVFADHPTWMQDQFFKRALDPGVEEKLQPPAFKAKEISRHDFEIAKANVKALAEAGLPLGFGTDSGATIYRLQGFAEHLELEALVSAGLTPAQALGIATRGSAAILGLESQRGTLEVGKKADFVVLRGNPLADIRNSRRIASVWIDGIEVSEGPLVER